MRSPVPDVRTRRLVLTASVPVMLLLAGCLGPGAPGSETDTGHLMEPATPASTDDAADGAGTSAAAHPSDEGADPWAGRERILLVHVVRPDVAFEADLLCTFGGGPRLDREPGRVPPGTVQLEVQVHVDATYTGLQVGSIVDGPGAPYASPDAGPIRWLPTVTRGADTFLVPVAPEEAEPLHGPRRWTFYTQMNLPGAEQDCYTGGGLGSYEVRIEAVRGEADLPTV